jgi:hypothetical protein
MGIGRTGLEVRWRPGAGRGPGMSGGTGDERRTEDERGNGGVRRERFSRICFILVLL